MAGSRILALDYGTKRIGVALSDELGWTAQPLETFERRTLDRDVAHIASLVSTHEVGQVVLGFPLQLDGREGPAVQAMRAFAVRLEESLAVPLVLWDERMTTKAAEDLLIAADVSRKKRKEVDDPLAHAILLQSYLPRKDTSVSQTAWPESKVEASTVHTSHEAAQHSHSSARHERGSRRRRLSGH